MRALHHFERFRARCERRSTLHVKPFEQPETNQSGADQVDRHHDIKQPRHDQDQDARGQRHYGRNVGSGDGH